MVICRTCFRDAMIGRLWENALSVLSAGGGASNVILGSPSPLADDVAFPLVAVNDGKDGGKRDW